MGIKLMEKFLKRKQVKFPELICFLFVCIDMLCAFSTVHPATMLPIRFAVICMLLYLVHAGATDRTNRYLQRAGSSQKEASANLGIDDTYFFILCLAIIGGILGGSLLLTLNGCSLKSPSDCKQPDRKSVNREKYCLFPKTSCCDETYHMVCCHDLENEDVNPMKKEAKLQIGLALDNIGGTFKDEVEKFFEKVKEIVEDEVHDELGLIWGSATMLLLDGGLNEVKKKLENGIEKANEKGVDMIMEHLKPVLVLITRVRRIKNTVDFLVFDLGRKSLILIPLLTNSGNDVGGTQFVAIVDLLIFLYFAFYGAYFPGSLYNKLHVVLTGIPFPKVKHYLCWIRLLFRCFI